MLRIPSMEVENFKSFVGVHRWDLGDVRGLYWLTGRNSDNDRLSSNGVGKSSLLDAISWCFFNRTTRLLRGGDVVSYNTRSCRVSVNACIRGQSDTITRIQNPNSLTLNNKIIDQDEFIKYLGLNHKSFLYSVIHPQFGESFLDLTPSEKLSLFTEIMNLDYWLEKSKQAEKEALIVKNQITMLENEIARLEGKKSSTSTLIEDLKLKSKNWENDKKAKLDRLKSRLNTVAQNEQQLKFKLLECEKSDVDYLSNLEKLKVSVNEEDKKRIEIDIDLNTVDTEVAILQSKHELLKDKLTNLYTLGPVCDRCNRPIDAKHVKDDEKRFKSDLSKIENEINGLDLIKKEIGKDRNKFILNIRKLTEELDSSKSKYQKNKYQIDNINSEIRLVQRDVKRQTVEIKEEEQKVNDFEDMINSKNNDLMLFDIDIGNKASKIKKLNEDHVAVSYWVTGFKQIRLNIVEETLRTLELEVNNNLSSLGLTDWTIEFDVERENKSGGITKGFTTIIRDSDHQVVKYESLSGGEGQRVRLAGTFGLSNLIAERAGLVLGIQLFDEPSQHLSTEGIEDMLNTLRDKAIDNDRQIWVIDHHSVSYADFSGVVTITKDEQSSRIQTQ